MRRNQPCKSQIQKNNHTERETILTRTIHKADTQANKSSNSAWQEPGKKKTVRTGNQVWYKPDISLTVQWRSYIITKFVFSSVGLQIFVREKTVQHTDTEPHRQTDRQTEYPKDTTNLYLKCTFGSFPGRIVELQPLPHLLLWNYSLISHRNI